MTPDPIPAAACGERGFILVGVVMFMLALTILGLSLFALSSYESQFFYASVSREQALQRSQSGLELVKALLAAPPRTLESAQLAVGQLGITRAIAYQQRSGNPDDTTSRGPVNWDSTVVIVVGARTGAEERVVQSRFIPVARKNPYQQLVSCGQSIWYNTSQGTALTLDLQGQVWQHVQTAADTAWTAYVNWPTGRPLETTAPPAPLADAFVDGHVATALVPTDLNLSAAYIKFDAVSNGPVFYRSPTPLSSAAIPPPPEQNWYEFYSNQDITLGVRGTVVWVVGQGVCFLRHVVVQALGPNDPANPNALVIVAKANGRETGPGADPNRAIWFKGGLEINDPNHVGLPGLFLVSQADISFFQPQDDRNDSYAADAVAIVAGGNVELMGPNVGSTNRLSYPSGMDPVADLLLAAGALPPTTGGLPSFAYAHGSWAETRLP